MKTDTIYEERGSDWSRQVSAVATTWWLQHDQTLPLSAKGVARETRCHPTQMHITGISHLSTYMQRQSELHSSLHFGATTTQRTFRSCLSTPALCNYQCYAPPHPYWADDGDYMGIWLIISRMILLPSLRGFDYRVCPTIGAIDILISQIHTLPHYGPVGGGMSKYTVKSN